MRLGRMIGALLFGRLPGCAALLGGALLLFAGGARAEELRVLTAAEYQGELARMQGLVAACQARAADCTPGKVGDDVRVDSPGGEFLARRDWLRSALEKGKDAKAEDRNEVLAAASARLVSDGAEAGGGGQDVALAKARAEADAVLNAKEFGRVQEQSYWAKKLAVVAALIDGAFTAAGALVPHSPWIGVALEWGLLALAAAGLLVWALRVSRQQRMAIVTGGAGHDGAWEKESDDWAARAQAAAAGGEWREAVHCLYWAAIVMLEGQRMWRANRARTPREYVQLLEPGSGRRRALGGLTRVFERIWYGLRPAVEGDFRQAEGMLAELRAEARLSPAGGAEPGGAAMQGARS